MPMEIERGFYEITLVWGDLNPSELWIIWSRGYKTFFMLNSAKYEIYPAQKW